MLQIITNISTLYQEQVVSIKDSCNVHVCVCVGGGGHYASIDY